MKARTAPPARVAVTAGAPHVRDAIDVAAVMRLGALALLPCVLAGTYATGRQIHLALEGRALSGAGWHGSLLAALGFGADASSPALCALHGLLAALPLFAASLLVVHGWEWAFSAARARPRTPGAFLLALLFTLAMPVTVPWWQAAVALSFGVVVGKEIFGGTGRNIVHPAVAAVTFLALAWPEALRGTATWVPVDGAVAPSLYERAAAGGVAALEEARTTWWDALLGGQPASIGAASPLACLLGGAFLAGKALVSVRTVLAVALGATSAAWLFAATGLGGGPVATLPAHWHLVLGSLTFGAVFLATDPVTTPRTNAGRWIHGLLLGGVIVMIRLGNPAHPEGTYLALLVGSIFAPLNDAVVVWFHTRHRRRRLA